MFIYLSFAGSQLFEMLKWGVHSAIFQVGYNEAKPYPIINAPKWKPVLPSTAQTRNSTLLKICRCIVLTLTGEQKVFSVLPVGYC